MSGWESGTDELTLLMDAPDGPDCETAHELRGLTVAAASLTPVPTPGLAALLELVVPTSSPLLHAVRDPIGPGPVPERERRSARARTWRRLAGVTPAVAAMVAGTAVVAAASIGVAVHARSSEPPAGPAAPAGTVAPGNGSPRPSPTADRVPIGHSGQPTSAPASSGPADPTAGRRARTPGGNRSGTGSAGSTAAANSSPTAAPIGSSPPVTAGEHAAGADTGQQTTSAPPDSPGSPTTDQTSVPTPTSGDGEGSGATSTAGSGGSSGIGGSSGGSEGSSGSGTGGGSKLSGDGTSGAMSGATSRDG